MVHIQIHIWVLWYHRTWSTPVAKLRLTCKPAGQHTQAHAISVPDIAYEPRQTSAVAIYPIEAPDIA
eukprot:1197138-Rhodomonas_salina.7